MLELRKVAVTGGLSSGKSTVCRILQQLGATVVSADEIVHKLLNQDNSLQLEIVRLLGPEVIEKGIISRKAIADKAFQDQSKLNQLEHLLHPRVRKELINAYEMEKQQGSSPIFVAEVPLLFEAGMEDWFDVTVVVAADPQLQKTRFTGTKEDFERRSERQMKPEDKIKKANFVLLNNGSIQELENSVKTLFTRLKNHEL